MVNASPVELLKARYADPLLSQPPAVAVYPLVKLLVIAIRFPVLNVPVEPEPDEPVSELLSFHSIIAQSLKPHWV